MIGTVDLVIDGDARASRAVAVVALQRGQRVLVVLRSADARVARRLRRSLLKAAGANGGQLVVITSAELSAPTGSTEWRQSSSVTRGPAGCRP